MAFVFRNQRNFNSPSLTPAPTHYLPTRPSPSKDLAAPFNQTQPRNIWKINKNPAPTDYLPKQQSPNYESIVLAGGKVVQLTQPPQTSMFKSGSVRFGREREDSPGPGSYNVKKESVVKEKCKAKGSRLQRYLQAAHQPVEEEDDIFVIGEEEGLTLEERRNLFLQRRFQENRKVPFNCSSQKSMKIRPKTSVGPGSYNVEIHQKSSMQNGVNQISNRKDGSLSLAKYKKMQPKQLPNKGVELNLDCMFGSVNNKQDHCSSKQNFGGQVRDDFFGSTVSRFYPTELIKTPGPGDYEVLPQQTKSMGHIKKSVCFGRSSSKAPQYNYQAFVNPFGIIQQRKTPSRKKDIKNKPNFGSQQPRFKPEKQKQMTSDCEGTLQIGVAKDKQNRAHRLPRRKRQEGKVLKKEEEKVDWRPISYDSWENTMNKKVGYKYQINAPFSTQVPRFTQTQQDSTISQVLTQPQSRQPNQTTILKKETKGLMQSNNPRFDYRQPANPLSPCSYNPQKLQKKQFNKLFV